MASRDINLNLNILEKFIEALSGNPKVKVGILGGDDAREDGSSNATIGAIHEFGLGHMPKRSFLRMPLIDGLNEAVGENITPKDLNSITDNASLVPIVRKIGIIAEEVILKAFDTQGNGKWVGWKKGYTSKTGMILQNDQELRNSISSEVVED